MVTEQKAVREMLTQESTWVRFTWNAGAAAGMRWNGNIRHIVEKMEEKVKKGDKKIQHKCLAETKGGKAQGDDRRGGSNKAQEAS